FRHGQGDGQTQVTLKLSSNFNFIWRREWDSNRRYGFQACALFQWLVGKRALTTTSRWRSAGVWGGGGCRSLLGAFKRAVKCSECIGTAPGRATEKPPGRRARVQLPGCRHEQTQARPEQRAAYGSCLRRIRSKLPIGARPSCR